MNDSFHNKSWLLRTQPTDPVPFDCNDIANELKIPPQIASILICRGLTDAGQIQSFLDPSLDQLPSPFLMEGMEEAVCLLADAVKNKKPVAVFGDYDVDGITASALLVSFFQELDIPVFSYQPDRLTEGYGLSISGVKKLFDSCKKASENEAVLITVDCGISNHHEIVAAKSLGFKVIVTDHHKPPENLPEANVIINPLQPGCNFPYKHLAGVGVAFYLIMGLRNRLAKLNFWSNNRDIPNLKQYMDLVALGSVCDLVPLTGVNRVLVKAGLETLQAGTSVGIEALKDVSGLSGQTITAESIAFRFGPRINAVGRLGRPAVAVEMLLEKNVQNAKLLAKQLDDANNERKSIEIKVYEEIKPIAEKYSVEKKKTLVLQGNWHPGVLGIIASKLTEKYFKPAIILSSQSDGSLPDITKETLKGSGRSIPGLNLYNILLSCSEYLVKFGGHDGAAGLMLHEENFKQFSDCFEETVANILGNDDLIPSITVDACTDLNILFDDFFLSCYSKLHPFGMGNPEPVFTVNKTFFHSSRIVGRNHLKFSLLQNGFIRNGIGFGLGYLYDKHKDSEVDLAFNLRLNEFKGQKNWEFNLIDAKHHIE